MGKKKAAAKNDEATKTVIPLESRPDEYGDEVPLSSAIWETHSHVCLLLDEFDQALRCIRKFRDDPGNPMALLKDLASGYEGLYFRIDSDVPFFTAARIDLNGCRARPAKFLGVTAGSMHEAAVLGLEQYLRTVINDHWQTPNEFAWNWKAYFTEENLRPRFTEWSAYSCGIEFNRRIFSLLQIEAVQAMRVASREPELGDLLVEETEDHEEDDIPDACGKIVAASEPMSKTECGRRIWPNAGLGKKAGKCLYNRVDRLMRTGELPYRRLGNQFIFCTSKFHA